MCCMRLAAGSSYGNDVEGTFPVANLAMQNLALERSKMSDEMEIYFKSANGAKSIRTKISNSPGHEKQQSMAQLIETLESRLGRIEYCDNKATVTPPAPDTDIGEMQELLRTIDPDFDATKSTCKDLSKLPNLPAFMEKHMTIHKYCVTVMKCGEASCSVCLPVRMPQPVFQTLKQRDRIIPFPQEGINGHFKSHDEVKNHHTTDKSMPSFKVSKEASYAAKEVDKQTKAKYSGIFGQKKVRAFVECMECQKPRLVHSMEKPSREVQNSLEDYLDEVYYQCGDNLFSKDLAAPPGHEDIFYAKRALTCGMPVEKCYYSSALFPAGVCAHCAESDDAEMVDLTQINLGGKKAYMYPICEQCYGNNIKPITHGKQGWAGARPSKGNS